MPTKIATFALGCFWSAEETFRTMPGVVSTAVGYMERAEVVQVTFDSAQIAYESLLTIFWDNHNPTPAASNAPKYFATTTIKELSPSPANARWTLRANTASRLQLRSLRRASSPAHRKISNSIT